MAYLKLGYFHYRIIMAMIVLLVFLVSNTCHVSGNRDIIGSGYSIQNGNPDGVNPISGGLDPGILHDRKILQTEGYPQAVIRDLEQTCRRSESVEWYYSPFSYQEKLRQSIKAFGNGNVKLREMAFTKSPQFLHYVQNTFGHNDVVQEIIKTCSFGNTRYAVDIVDCKHFTVTDAFAADVCSLNLSYDFDQYKSFLDRWGTHVIVEAEFGMKTITRYKINDVELFKIVLENVPEAVLETDNSSRTIDFNVFSSSPYFSTAINEFSENLTIGTKKEPLPIALRIMSIDTIIQTKFWSKVDSLIQRGICAEGTKLSDILAKQKHLKTALAEVAETNYTPLYSRKRVHFADNCSDMEIQSRSCPQSSNICCRTGKFDCSTTRPWKSPYSGTGLHCSAPQPLRAVV